MAFVYILYSSALNKYYTGSCKDIYDRVHQHLNKVFPRAFTGKAKDWILYFLIENLGYKQARLIERHIKRMKSKIYIENFKEYPEISQKLIRKYDLKESCN